MSMVSLPVFDDCTQVHTRRETHCASGRTRIIRGWNSQIYIVRRRKTSESLSCLSTSDHELVSVCLSVCLPACLPDCISVSVVVCVFVHKPSIMRVCVFYLLGPAWGRGTFFPPFSLLSIHFLILCSCFTFPFSQWL